MPRAEGFNKGLKGDEWITEGSWKVQWLELKGKSDCSGQGAEGFNKGCERFPEDARPTQWKMNTTVQGTEGFNTVR